MPLPAVALVTFGCAKNLVDSEVMLGYLGRGGYRFVDDPARADIIVLNTCGFIQPSRDEADEAIAKALAEKTRRGARVVVAGCYAERDRGRLAERYPGVDAWVGVKDYDRIREVVAGEEYRRGGRTFLYGHETPRVLSTPRGWAYLKVSEGCSHGCAFCAIPLIKGAYRSRPAVSILEEARRLAAAGVREIVLISQDTSYYGRDKGRRHGLARLLRDLAGIPDLDWIRFLYGYPEEIDDELLEALAGPKICRYLDIPFQHADPALVKAMGRTMPAPRALRLLERIRRRLPDAAVRTSVIVGFPGEGRREFEALAGFVRDARFDHLGVFTYSREEGTAAYGLGDPVPATIKEKRRHRILEIQAGLSRRRLTGQVGRTLEVLVEGPYEKSERLLVGRTRFQAPEVDGIVLVERPKGWDPRSAPIRPVEITAADVYDLHGRFVDRSL
jgi:ribosomal protein S12 methylthiotransferase